MRALIPIVLAALLALAGCAARKGATPAETTPAAVPRATPPKPPGKPAVPDRPVVGTGSESTAAAPAPTAPAPPAPPAGNPPAAASRAADSSAPDAAVSAYVFSPQQAVTTRPSSSPQPGRAPEPPQSSRVPDARTGAPQDPAPRPEGTSGRTRGELQLQVVASALEIAPGGIMTVDVMASSSTAVVDAPLHLHFDPKVVEFVDGSPGDFLTQGGSSIVFFADGRSRPGDVAVAAGRVEREQGASGAGLLCRVTFRGVGVGTTTVVVGQAKAWGTKGEELTVFAAGTSVAVH